MPPEILAVFDSAGINVISLNGPQLLEILRFILDIGKYFNR